MKQVVLSFLLFATVSGMVSAQRPQGGMPKLPNGVSPMEKPKSANVDTVKRKFLDLAYAKISPSEKLDIFLPNRGSGPFPVIMYVHGGAFMFGDKRGGSLADLLKGINQGYAIVSMNYRLSGEAIFPANIEDVKAAIRFLRGNAAKYHLNPNKIGLFGDSAGGYLVELAGTTDSSSVFNNTSMGYPKESVAVEAVVAIYAPNNFLTMDSQLKADGLKGEEHDAADSPESRVMGAQITKIPEKVKAANPATYLNKDIPPFLLMHGTADSTVPYQQSVLFAQEIQKIAGKSKVELVLVKGAHHADPIFTQGKYLKMILGFYDRYLK